MTVRVYRSTDAGAPSIGRVAGSLVTLLDACLVAGYGSKVGAGWTKAFTGTNQAVYQQGASLGEFLYLNDAGTDNTFGGGTGSNLYACAGATSISAHTKCWPYRNVTYTYFPCINKPDTLAGGGAWIVVANASAFFLFTKRAGWAAYSGFYFGPINSYVEDDLGRLMIISGGTSQPTATATPSGDFFGQRYIQTSQLAALHGHHMAGSPEGTADCGVGAFTTKVSLLGPIFNTSYFLASPGITRGPIFSPLYVFHIPGGGTGAMNAVHYDMRGQLMGMYHSMHDKALFNFYDGFTCTIGAGPLAGKTLECVMVYDSSTPYPAFIETSDTWEE